MTDEEPPEDATEEELRAQLRRTRSRVRELEAELTETNEGMVALTLELENAKERYRTIFAESTDGILLIDPDRDVIHEANPRACELLGYDHETLVTLSPAEVFPDEEDRTDSFAEAVVHGWADDFTCRTEGGRRVDVDVSAAMITLDGRSLLLASLRDITERKRREQRLQVLTRIFRHNLRNDGNVIQGHADILREELSGTAEAESVARIRGTIDRILRLSAKVRRVQDVLDLKRVYPVPVDELLARHRERLAEAYPAATVAIDPPAREVAVGRRLGLAVEEAVENAAEHAGSAATVAISATVDDERERVRIDIEDDGPGIPDHELEAIRSGVETPQIHGSGIGVWCIYWVVDSLGGELAVERGDPDGTVISLVAPIETVRPDQEARTT